MDTSRVWSEEQEAIVRALEKRMEEKRLKFADAIEDLMANLQDEPEIVLHQWQYDILVKYYPELLPPENEDEE